MHKKMSVIYVIPMTILFWSLLYFRFPHFKLTVLITMLSLIIIVTIPDRFIFPFVMAIILVYGGYLTMEAFYFQSNQSNQLASIYEHLHMMAILMFAWLFVSSIKKLQEEREHLQNQVQLLEKYKSDTNVLSVNEFKSQAEWLMKASERKKEITWLLDIKIPDEHSITFQNMMEITEKLALNTIRQKYDLVTSNDDRIIILLKDTTEDGVQVVLSRFNEKLRKEFNYIELPHQIDYKRVKNYDELLVMMERFL